MQPNSTHHVCASPAVLSCWLCRDKKFVTFEKHIFRFQVFLDLNCLLMFYTIYHGSCFLNDINWTGQTLKTFACCWPCWCQKRFSGLRRLENLELFESHICFGAGAQVMYRQKGKKLDGFFFCLTSVNLAARFFGKSFFLRLSFYR